METPFVSVIIPIFNVEKYLDECLSSIYEISCYPIEVILINDGSTDGSGDIAEKFKALHPENTILINKDYGGVSIARNEGLHKATGTWIAFLDSDDFIDSNAFCNVLQNASSSTADVIAFDGYRFVEETKKTLPLYTQANPYNGSGIVLSNEYLCTLIDSEMTNLVTIWDKVYRKSVIDELNIKFVEDILHEDVAFTFSILLSSLPIEFLPEKVVYYRQRPGSIMYTPSPQKVQSKVFLIDYLLDLYESKGLFNKLLNGYLVFTAKTAISQGGRVKLSTLNRVNSTTLSIKKRVILFSLYLLNLKN